MYSHLDYVPGTHALPERYAVLPPTVFPPLV